MKKTLILLALALTSCAKQKGYQIVVTPDKEYYVEYYTVDTETNCIEFTYYRSNGDSSFARVCPPWDVRPNLDYNK
jgi:hypothetical protein